ncbi:3-keto-disaccharide hydrolase [Haloferula sp.]|uniref:3-keto-disaccharide hydrolase n=1 Tax=Haloferula sp. TaxID=2497595 RepID=UPI003C719C8C
MMKPKLIALALSAFGLISLPLFAAEHPNTEDWESLFKPDLSNAVDAGKWTIEDGVLVARDRHTLWTKASYSDFVLDLEFKVEKASNSGVFLRSSDISNVLKALEIQVHESTDDSPIGMVGGIYDACPPSKSMAKPIGEWNRFTITCKGPSITLVFNGEQVLDVDLDRWNEAHKNPDGTPNKFAVALKDYARKGPIGFQGLHGKEQAPVYYRNLRIKPLD